MTIEELKSAHADGRDLGKEPSSRALTEVERKLIASSMAVNASIVQFMLEGIVPAEEQVHFMIHYADFLARLYAGEDVKINGIPSTFSVDSKAGELYLEAVEEALKHGKLPEQHAADETIVEDTGQDIEPKKKETVNAPSAKRYLN